MFFEPFVGVTQTYYIVYKITVYFHQFFFQKAISYPCPCHNRFGGFRVNKRIVNFSQISFFTRHKPFRLSNIQLKKKLSKSISTASNLAGISLQTKSMVPLLYLFQSSQNGAC